MTESVRVSFRKIDKFSTHGVISMCTHQCHGMDISDTVD